MGALVGLGAQMHVHVAPEARFRTYFLAADVAHVLLAAIFVDAHVVLREAFALRELLLAVLAFVLFLVVVLFVRFQMVYEGVFVVTGLATYVAYVGVGTVVVLHVLEVLVFGYEASVALCACLHVLFKMAAAVHHETLFSFVGFHAEIAMVGAVVPVDAHVDCDVVLSFKGFRADGALVGSFGLVADHVLV